LDLLDGYVHGGISRRDFLNGALKFAGGGDRDSTLPDAQAERCMGHA
jgi:hypothetical protein